VLLGCASVRSREVLRFTGLESPPKQFSGVLTLPKNKQAPFPIVLLVHGTAGADSRYAFHKPALLDAGIGTLEVDFKTNLFTGGSDRPPISSFHPWAFGALKALRAHPLIDANRIAIMGFSLGGHLSVSAASKNVVERWFVLHQPVLNSLSPRDRKFTRNCSTNPPCRLVEEVADRTIRRQRVRPTVTNSAAVKNVRLIWEG
ncbi:MAG: alpha/beta hydrolase, partial [Desulfobacterales bacterium]